MKVRWTDEALQDLDEIVDYVLIHYPQAPSPWIAASAQSFRGSDAGRTARGARPIGQKSASFHSATTPTGFLSGQR